jgi:hypothetical protein
MKQPPFAIEIVKKNNCTSMCVTVHDQQTVITLPVYEED